MIIGYARVSTEDQNLELQIQALNAHGCSEIYQDLGVSGSTNSRPGLDMAIASLKPGDTLIVWRLDRLGRSLTHLTLLLEQLGKKGIGFHSITEYMDTSSPGGRFLFHLMAALAEFERALISERTRAGMAAARAVGKNVGRRPALSQLQCTEAIALISKGEAILEVSRHLGVHPRTLQRYLKPFAGS